MKLGVTENGNLEAKEIYSPLKCISGDGEELSICMRDSGFEFIYQNKWFEAKGGKVEEIGGVTEPEKVYDSSGNSENDTAYVDRGIKITNKDSVADGKRPNLPIMEECRLEGAHSFKHQIDEMARNSTGDRPVHYTLAGEQQEILDDALEKAILVLRDRLKNDKEYRMVWKANLEMNFLGCTASKGADKFLDMLIG